MTGGDTYHHGLRFSGFDHADNLAHNSNVIRFFAGYFNRLVILIERLELNRVIGVTFDSNQPACGIAAGYC
jgi:hypothetical protein